MAFFEKLGETLSSTGKAAAQKTKEMADLAKLNSQVGQLEGKIKTWYQVIGEKVYQSEKDQEHSGLETEFGMITDAFAEIGRLKKQITEIRGMKTCPECGADVAKDASFCSKCGAKIEEPADNTDAEADDVVDDAADVVEETADEENAEEAAEEETAEEETAE